MAAGNFDIREIEKRMKGAVNALKQEFGGLRTGRASTTLARPVDGEHLLRRENADQPGGGH